MTYTEHALKVVEAYDDLLETIPESLPGLREYFKNQRDQFADRSNLDEEAAQ